MDYFSHLIYQSALKLLSTTNNFSAMEKENETI